MSATFVGPLHGRQIYSHLCGGRYRTLWGRIRRHSVPVSRTDDTTDGATLPHPYRPNDCRGRNHLCLTECTRPNLNGQKTNEKVGSCRQDSFREIDKHALHPAMGEVHRAPTFLAVSQRRPFCCPKYFIANLLLCTIFSPSIHSQGRILTN